MINKSKLIAINLNQSLSAFELEQRKKELVRWITFAFICTLFIVNLIWFIQINYKINNLIDKRETTISQLIKDTQSLKNSGQINLSKKDIENLYSVEKNRIRWANKLRELAYVTPEDMAITAIRFRNQKITIKAISLINENDKEFSIVENLINTLQNNDVISRDFSSIKFKSAERKITRGQEILMFVIEAKLPKES